MMGFIHPDLMKQDPHQADAGKQYYHNVDYNILGDCSVHLASDIVYNLPEC